MRRYLLCIRPVWFIVCHAFLNMVPHTRCLAKERMARELFKNSFSGWIKSESVAGSVIVHR